ncbi:hypothetical protein MKZ38_007572 [Zalerion maritima]|uniref:Uncharacterized protein n=1 Tax=Zalerion maritima TaxID=339359 RepID=A0AAD5RVH1_9PEZI|nr:hypothetical protein MKZ38_007572 [Zalerion maritima]
MARRDDLDAVNSVLGGGVTSALRAKEKSKRGRRYDTVYDEPTTFQAVQMRWPRTMPEGLTSTDASFNHGVVRRSAQVPNNNKDVKAKEHSKRQSS